MLDAWFAWVGALAVAVTFASRRIRHLPLSEPLLALVLGVALGPHGFRLLEVPDGSEHVLLHEGSEVLLAIAVMAVALRYAVDDLRQHLVAVAVLIAVVMPLTAAVAAVLAAAVLGLPVASAWVLGAAMSPTDPVLASSVVTGDPAERSLPSRLRQVLSTESGANDGLALPLVLLGVALVREESLGVWAREAAVAVVVAGLIGLVVGWLAGRVLRRMDEHHDVEPSAFFVFTLLLAVLVLGVTKHVHGDAVLAVFVAGLAYNRTIATGERVSEQTIEEGINRFLVLPLFALLGVALPWELWADRPVATIGFAVAALLLRRLPIVLLLRPVLRLRWRDAVFLGWFGPVGVAAIFYLLMARAEASLPPGVWAGGALLIALSTVAHGLTAAPGRKLYERIAEPSSVSRR